MLRSSWAVYLWAVYLCWCGFLGWWCVGGFAVGYAEELSDPSSCSNPPAANPPPCTQFDPSPQQGVLLLRNGEILEGKIVQVGDFYYVEVSNGQVRIRTADVETACRTLQEGYQFKRRNIRLPSAQEHLNLAQWCIRHGLVAEAERELTEAARLQPDHPLIPLVQRRIQIARQPKLFHTQVMPDRPAKTDAYELENWVRSLPTPVVEQFTHSVQPILLNNCTASGCHGPSEKNRFSLLKPPAGQSPTRRLTQRNLANTYQWINPKEPLRSPLLTAPLAPHGSAKTPIFGNPQAEAYQRLVRWVLLAASAGAMPEALARGSSLGPSGGPVADTLLPASASAGNPPVASTQVSPPNSLCRSRLKESQPSEGVLPAVAEEITPQFVQQAGVWQPPPGATHTQGPQMEALVSPPTGAAQTGAIPPAFLPWAAASNRYRSSPADSSPSNLQTIQNYTNPQSPLPPSFSNGSALGSAGSAAGQPLAPQNAANTALVAPSGLPPSPPGLPNLCPVPQPQGFSASQPHFPPPYRSEPKRGNPMGNQFRPVDPFDPELFNRRYHPPDASR